MPVMTPPTTEQLWNLCQHHKMKHIAEKYRLTTQEMVARFRQEGFMGEGPKDPSPEEIEVAKRKIRSGWDAATTEARWIGTRGRMIG